MLVTIAQVDTSAALGVTSCVTSRFCNLFVLFLSTLVEVDVLALDAIVDVLGLVDVLALVVALADDVVLVVSLADDGALVVDDVAICPSST